jgi:hypothetical protein
MSIFIPINFYNLKMMKKITLVFLFFLGTITASYGQFSESFDAGTTTPAGWSVISGGGPNTFIFGVGSAGSAFSAPNAAQINYDATAHDDYLVTPQIAVTAGLNDRLTYFVKNQDPLYVEAYEVKLSTTTATAGAFTVVVTPEADAPNAWTQFTIDLTPYVGQSIYIGFHAVSTDKFRLLFDNVVNDTPPAVAPNCVTLTAPLNAATGVSPSPSVTLSWTAATTGPAASSYDVYLDTNTNPTTLLGNQVTLTRTVTGLLSTTAYYWKVVAKNSAGEATGCSVFSFTTSVDPFAPYCGPLVFTATTDAVEPITLVNFAGINNSTSATVAGATGHEVFTTITGNVTAGSSYSITLKGNTGGNYTNRFIVFADWNQDGDFGDSDESYPITQTITNSTGLDAQQATQSLLVPPTATVGNTRMRVKKIFGTADFDNPCLGTAFGQVEDYTLAVAAVPADLPDYVNLQFPPTATIAQGGNVTVYGQVYEGGLTDVAPNIVGQAPGINAWVGVNATNTNPNTWTTWTPATWNAGHISNNDEYQLSIGTALAPGTYYYATRFQLNGGAFVYGGINQSPPNNGNFWNGTTFVNGILTVTAPLPPANDECTAAIALTPGGVFTDNDVDGTNLAATLSANTPIPTCGAFNFATSAKDVWYSVVVPASGTLTIETSTNSSAAPGIDTVIAVYSGDCSTLVEVGCDDDGATEFAVGLSRLALTGQTPGATLLIRLFGYNGVQGLYSISAFDASLGNNSFDNANFSYYPNPVKNTLNLSYNQEISNVEIFNLLGQKVNSNSINANQGQVDMSNLSNGVYLVKVTSNNQEKTIRVIKE